MADNDDGTTLPKLSLKKPGEPAGEAPPSPPPGPPSLQPPSAPPAGDGPPNLTLSKPGGDSVISLKKPGEGGDAGPLSLKKPGEDGAPPKLTLRKPGGEALPPSAGAPAVPPPAATPPPAAPPASGESPAAPPPATPPSLAPPPSLSPPPIKPSGGDEEAKAEEPKDAEGGEAAAAAPKKKPKIKLPDFGNMDKKQKIIIGAVAAVIVLGLVFFIMSGGDDQGDPPPTEIVETPAVEEEDPLFGDLEAEAPPELAVGPSDPTEVAPNEWALKVVPGRIIIKDDAIFEAVEDAFTIEYWVKPDLLPVDGSVFVKGGESDEAFRLGLRKTPAGMTAEFATAAEPDRILSAVAPSDGWIHLSAVYVGDAKKIMLLFVNGSRMATETSRQLITPACNALVVEVEGAEGEALVDDIHVANAPRYLRHFRPRRKQKLDANSASYIHLELSEEGPVVDQVRQNDITLEGADWANIAEEIKMSDVLAATVILPHHVFLKVKENFTPSDLDKFMQTWAGMDSSQRTELLSQIGHSVQ